MRKRLFRFIPGLLVLLNISGFAYRSQLPAAPGRTGVQQESRQQLRQRLLDELQNLAAKISDIVIQERVDQLASLLSYTITVELDLQIPADAVRKDLQNHGGIYCRIFNTACARRIYARNETRAGRAAESCRLSQCFVSARDVLIRQRSNLRREVHFYMPDKEEDFDFAYITYLPGQDAVKYGWKAGVMVGLERIGGQWKICALFPLDY